MDDTKHTVADAIRPPLQHPSAAAMAWYGNAAKMRIVERLAATDAPLTVFDFGAGRGAGWAETLKLCPNITLVCYEPHGPSVAALRQAVPAATIHDGDPSAITQPVDVIVSFSVFEHVWDRKSYLAHAARMLKPEGRFFLNYDDGHFREPGSMLAAARNAVAPVLPRVGLTGQFQATVRKPDADRMIAAAGLVAEGDRYENLESMKALAKTIPADRRADFAAMWLDLEDRLNADFTAQAAAFNGDTTNLWREMASRTLELRRA